jgi:hypothetical protein
VRVDPWTAKEITTIIMNLSEIEDQSIALIIWNRDKENDVHVYSGKLKYLNGTYAFVNEENGWKVSLNDEQLSRLKPVTPDLKEMLLNADYALSLNMGELPEAGNKGGEENTGINWNK